MAENAMTRGPGGEIPNISSPRTNHPDTSNSGSNQAAEEKSQYGRFIGWLGSLGCGLPRRAATRPVVGSPVDTSGQTRPDTNGATSPGPPRLAVRPPSTLPGDSSGNRPASTAPPSTNDGADPGRSGSVDAPGSVSTGTPTTVTGSVANPTRLLKPDKCLVFLVQVGRENRWVGRPHLYPVPDHIAAALNPALQQRISVDLLEFENTRYRCDSGPRRPFSSFFEPQISLEWSGVMDRKDKSITLHPSIRIDCDDRKYEIMTQAVKKAVPYLCDTVFKYIRASKIKDTGAREDKDEGALALTNPGETADQLLGLEVEFHVGYLNATPGNNSSQLSLIRTCEVRPSVCRTTLYRDGVKVAARYSRVGGPLIIGNRQVYITTAHQIFDMILFERFVPLESVSGQRPEDGADTDTQLGSDDHSMADGSSQHPSEDEYRCSTLPKVDFSQTKAWEEVALPFGARYGRLEALPAEKGRSRVVPVRDDRAMPNPDCAILHVEDQTRSPVPSPAPLLELPANQQVRILLSNPDGDEVVKGYTCAQASPLRPHKDKTPTVLLSLFVALPPGSSGAWVEKDGQFCGMIVSSYQDEPMAHMIESKRLVDYVRRNLLDTAKSVQSKAVQDSGNGSKNSPGPRFMFVAREIMRLHDRKPHDANSGRQKAERPSVGSVRTLTGGSAAEPTSTQMQAWSEGVSNSNDGEVQAALQSREIKDLATLGRHSRTSSGDMGSRALSRIQRFRPSSLTQRGSAGEQNGKAPSEMPVEASSQQVLNREPSSCGAIQDETVVSHAGAHLPVPDEGAAADRTEVDSISLTPRQSRGDGFAARSSQRWAMVRGLAALLGVHERSRRRGCDQDEGVL